MAIGTGKIVFNPWITSNPNSSGIFSRVCSTAIRWSRFVSFASLTNRSAPAPSDATCFSVGARICGIGSENRSVSCPAFSCGVICAMSASARARISASVWRGAVRAGSLVCATDVVAVAMAIMPMPASAAVRMMGFMIVSDKRGLLQAAGPARPRSRSCRQDLGDGTEPPYWNAHSGSRACPLATWSQSPRQTSCPLPHSAADQADGLAAGIRATRQAA